MISPICLSKRNLPTILFPLLISWMTVFTSKFPNSARDVVVSCTVPDEKSWKGSYIADRCKWCYCMCTFTASNAHKQTFPPTHSTVSPCTCSVQPLFWSYRCGACPWFHSLRRQRDRSHSAGRRLPGWPEEVTCPARATQDNAQKQEATCSEKTALTNRCVALHGRSSPRPQPVRRWSGSLPIGRESRPWLGPSQTFLCPGSVEATSRSHWPHLPLHLWIQSLSFQNASQRYRQSLPWILCSARRLVVYEMLKRTLPWMPSWEASRCLRQ